MSIVMYDVVPEEVGNVPANPQAVAGYVNGRYQSFPILCQRFPNAHHLSITVNAYGAARCLDIEQYDASPPEAPGWYHNYADHSQGRVVLYCSASLVSTVVAAMNSAGIGRSAYLIWAAHYGQGEHVCGPNTCGYPQADGTQWSDMLNGHSCDVSLVSDEFFGAQPVRPHGIANAELHFDVAKGHWGVVPTAGQVVFDPVNDRWASAEVQINTHTGAWRVRPMAWNAGPLGG